MYIKRYPESYHQEHMPALCEAVNKLHDEVRERRIFEALCLTLKYESPERKEMVMAIIEGRIHIGS